MSQPIVDQLVVMFIVRFFFVFGIVGFAVGVGLILSPVGMQRISGILNHWVSMRHSTRWLAIPRDTGRAVQRFRLSIGAFFILGAGFSTFILITQIDADRVVAALHVEAPYFFAVWIMESVRWLLIVGGMIAILIGIMLIVFPDALRKIEVRANHWYSSRGQSRSGDAMHMGLDSWIEGHPQVTGWVISAAALVVVVAHGLLLFAGR